MAKNPFSVKSPEILRPQEIADSFVEMYTDFPKLQEPINLFIHGPRGSGKSIMLRSLERKVQALMPDEEKADLPFFAVHVPIKHAFFGNPEFQRLIGWKATTVGEHLLTIHTTQYLCEVLFENEVSLNTSTKREFLALWEDCGGTVDSARSDQCQSYGDLAKFCERETQRVRQYFVRLPETEDRDLYDGALTSLNDFLLIFVRELLSDESIGGDPICFMIDDADNLPENLQKVLNSWVSSRVSKLACFKVTTQLGYKTYKTIDDRVIESPHDFSEINIGSVYTSNKGNFAKRIEAIVAKRLTNAGINQLPIDFFPLDTLQEKRRKEIWSDLSEGRTETHVQLRGGGPSRSRDYAQRYTVPALMRERQATKSTHTFSYAGLQSLTDLSSGVVRWFLEPASQMYHVVRSGLDESADDSAIRSIPVGVQDAEIQRWSKEFREKLDVDPGSNSADETASSLQSFGHTKESYAKLGSLLDGVGFLCRERVLDPAASEQRLFSVVLNDDPREELSDILHLGVRLGYLQKADLASKTANGGRRPRYILSRRLGPHYGLDVSGYAAHLSVKCDDLELALRDAEAFSRSRARSDSGHESQTTIDFGESS